MNPRCPICLKRTQRMAIKKYGFYFTCAEHGDLLNTKLIRKIEGGLEFIARLEKMPLLSYSPDKKLACPFCVKTMATHLISNDSQTRIDRCLRCLEVWFDRGELENARKQGEVEELFPSAARSMQEARAQRLDDRRQDRYDQSVEKISDLSAAELLGLPDDARVESRNAPYVTGILIFIAFLFSAKSMHDPALLRNWSYNPEAPLRHLGLPLAFASFCNPGWMSLAYHSFYLFLFGSKIESRAGSLRVLEVFLFSSAGALLVMSLLKIKIAAFGLTAGVSGLLGYCFTMYPHDEYRYMFWRFTPIVSELTRVAPLSIRLSTLLVSVSFVAVLLLGVVFLGQSMFVLLPLVGMAFGAVFPWLSSESS